MNFISSCIPKSTVYSASFAFKHLQSTRNSPIIRTFSSGKYLSRNCVVPDCAVLLPLRFQFQLQLIVNRRSLTTSNTMSNKKALVVIAHGSEEIELVTPIDTLRRAGVEVTVAGLLAATPVICSRNVIIAPDTSFKEATSSQIYDAVLLPGGAKGAEAFINSADLGQFLQEQEKNDRLIAAICAAPTALKFHGICFGKSITSYPSTKNTMIEGGRYKYVVEDRVVIDGNLITSQGPGTALEWSLAITEYLVGKDKAHEVGKAMLAHGIS